ncbi:hypothetical protein FB451DRAFT_1374359 [Mycena latifolia]|nr:hypothetical protein FB451DRAFT_1374359 [Mycena latifolia]
MRTLLKACHTGLAQGLEVFKVAAVLSDRTAMQQYAQKMHQEVLELISTLSDVNSTGGSSISRSFSSSHHRVAIWVEEEWGKQALEELFCITPKSLPHISSIVSLLPVMQPQQVSSWLL